MLPGFVATNMSKLRPGFATPTATAYVKQALRSLGTKAVTNGAAVHQVQVRRGSPARGWRVSSLPQTWVQSLLPVSLYTSQTLKMLGAARKKALSRRNKVN